MDRVEPVDLTDIERPELLGGLILEKTAEEMDEYLNTGDFPQDNENETPSSPASRRVPAGTVSPSTNSGVGPRRGAPSPAEGVTPRGPVRGSRRGGGNNEEVF